MSLRLYHLLLLLEVMSVSKNQDLMYVETGDEDGWRITALSSDAEGGYRPPVAFKKRDASQADDPNKDPPTDDVTSGIERLALEESTHVVSKDVSSGSVEPLPSSGPSEPSPGVSAEKPLPPSIVDAPSATDSFVDAPSATDSFVDAPSAKDTRKEEELVQSKEPEPKKEEAAMAVEEEQEKEKEQDDEVTFESLPDKPSEVMEPDFSPDRDEEMAQKPLPELEDSSANKDISLGAKPKSAPSSRPTLETFSRGKSLLIADGADSDSNAPRAFPPSLLEVVPSRSSLRNPSRPKSRPPSRSRGQSRQGKRTDLVPEQVLSDVCWMAKPRSPLSPDIFLRPQGLCLSQLQSPLSHLSGGCQRTFASHASRRTFFAGQHVLCKEIGMLIHAAGPTFISVCIFMKGRPSGLCLILAVLRLVL